MQATEACQQEETILNGIKAMGKNIAKAMNTELKTMSAQVDMLNQVSLDTIMDHLITPKRPQSLLPLAKI
jgi:hypothetical protein